MQQPPGMQRVYRGFGVWTAGVILFLYLPIVLLLVYSFNDSKLNVVWRGFTLRWYGVLWQDESLMSAAGHSLSIAAVTTVLSTVLGTAGAWMLYRYRFPGPRWLETLILVPVVIPEVVMGISLLVFFVVIGMARGFATVIIAHTTFCFPYVLIAVQARLADLDPSLEEAAMDLYATPMQAFTYVMLPQLMPAVVAGALMAFTLSLDELIVTYFTAGPGSETLPMKIFGMARVGMNPTLNAISALFIVATVVLVVVAERLRQGKKG